MTEPMFDHEKLDVYRWDVMTQQDKNRYFQIARGSALECTAVHDILTAFAMIDDRSEPPRQSATEAARVDADSIDPAG
jgi:hypothetical protein